MDFELLLQIMSGVVTPIMIALLMRSNARARSREEYWRSLELQLHPSRLKVYREILELFSVIFANEEGIAHSQKYKEFRNRNRKSESPLTITKESLAVRIMNSPENKEVNFRLSLLGSDPVVKAYNRLMTEARKLVGKDTGKENNQILIIYLADFLLELRKNLGNEGTSLKNTEMLEWLITDIEKLETLFSDEQKVAVNSTT